MSEDVRRGAFVVVARLANARWTLDDSHRECPLCDGVGRVPARDGHAVGLYTTLPCKGLK